MQSLMGQPLPTTMNTWMAGSEEGNQKSVYGLQGLSPEDIQLGSRQFTAYWTDNAGDLWVFGGAGQFDESTTGSFNDLWKYERASNLWTWMGGTQLRNQGGTYGTRGVAHADNIPGARTKASFSKDADGNFILFGGYGFDSNGSVGFLNDIWSFNPQTLLWTWLGGSSTFVNTAGSYGTKGVSSPSNFPAGRFSATVWADGTDGLWLFGGNGRGNSTEVGLLNDFWYFSFDENEWVWIAGEDTIDGLPEYGEKNVFNANNIPGARREAASFKGADNRLYLFGAESGRGDNGLGRLNDLWVYDPAISQWSWIHGSKQRFDSGNYGTIGMPNPANYPNSRGACAHTVDENGTFWIFGGGFSQFYYNDIWQYNPETNIWTWMGGNNEYNTSASYGEKGVVNPSNMISARKAPAMSVWENKAMIFGGNGNESGLENLDRLSDLWSFDANANQWVWINGAEDVDALCVYGALANISSQIGPGGREQHGLTMDSNGDLWVFGGWGFAAENETAARLNDLWKFDKTNNKWVWVSGSTAPNAAGDYDDLHPGARRNHGFIADSNGNLWLFGGEGYDGNGQLGRLSDVWKFDITTMKWNWVGGSNLRNISPQHGTLGNGHASNTPGGRELMAMVPWRNHGFFIYGGKIGADKYNDLWYFNFANSQWTWSAGDNTANELGKYELFGDAHPNNMPASREQATITTDHTKFIWLFGGLGSDGVTYNDLWRFNISTQQWAWLSGAERENEADINGSRGVESETNLLGGRIGAKMWLDPKGEVWIFGGVRNSIRRIQFWKFNPNNGYWTWVSGTTTFSVNGNYGTLGIAHPDNQIGTRQNHDVHFDGKYMWLFGGDGRDGTINTTNRRLSDLWRFDLILDNSAPTDILLSKADVDENQTVGTLVGEFSAVDSDENEFHAFALVSGTGATDNSRFYIEEGKLFTSQQLNYELKSELSIRVRVTDKGGLIYDKIFTINVNDLPETPTDILLTSNEIEENKAINTVIGQLSAIDEDFNEIHTFSLVSGAGSIDNHLFNISGSNLRSSAVFDYEGDKNQYSIRIRVTDKDGLSFEKTFIIYVLDVNEPPTDIFIDNDQIEENLSPDVLIGTFTTEDPDTGDNHTYSLIEISGSDAHESFYLVDDQLFAALSFNYEEKSSYTVRIRSTDIEGLYLEKDFIISIIDMPDAPTDIYLYPDYIEENQPIGTLVGELTAEDEDAGESHVFTFISGPGSADNGDFSIVGNQLYSEKVFQYELQQIYNIRIRVTDKDALTFDKALEINIIDENDPPVNLALSSNTIEENAAIGTQIGFFTNEDPDLNETHVYQLVSGAGDQDNAFFEIDDDILRNAVVFNYEDPNHGPEYSIRVRVTDKGGLYTEEEFQILVLDVNEPPTALLLDGQSIAENESIGSLIGTFSTQDEDINDTHTYSLVSGSASEDNQFFSIVDDKLFSNVVFDYETKNQYSIRVRVSDKGGLFLDEIFEIQIIDVNEAPTTIFLSNTSIEENQPIGTLVGLFTNDDPDLDENHVYTLVEGEGDADNAFFQINEDRLESAVVFNYEDPNRQPLYSIRVKVTDKEGLTAAKSFTITIIDVNDPPSAILLSNKQVEEAQPANTLVGFIETTDEDDPEGIDVYTYDLVVGDGDEDNAFFMIAGNQLLTAEVLRRSDKTVRSIRIRTTDNGGLSFEQQFNITIIAVADTEPPTISNIQLPAANSYLLGSNEGHISFQVEDNFVLDKVHFYARQIGDMQFDMMNMAVNSSGIYQVKLTDDLLGESGLDFYIYAADTAGNETQSHANQLFVRYPSDAGPILSDLGYGARLEDYRMFAIPYSLEDSRIETLFVRNYGPYNQVNWRLLHWDNGRYIEFQSGLTNIEPGKGYWFNSLEAQEINIGAAQVAAYSAEQPYQMNLQAGWNQIGNPYNFDISWTNVLNANGNPSGISQAKVFDGTAYQNAAVLKKYEGAFVFAEEAGSLIIPVQKAAHNAQRLAHAPSKKEDTQWQMSLFTQTNQQQSNTISIAMLDRAMERDVLEAIPPRFANTLAMASVRKERLWPYYEQDWAMASHNASWQIEVVAGDASSQHYSINWSIDHTPSKGQLMMVDEAEAKVIDMSEHASYSFSISGSKTFHIYYNSDGVDQMDFNIINAGLIYPNPMTTEAYIPLILPHANTNYRVEVLAFDLSGKSLGHVYKADLAEGYHLIHWERRGLKSGMYLYRVRVKSDEGEFIYSGKISIK